LIIVCDLEIDYCVLNNMNVLIIGSTGFLGSNLAQSCLNEGWSVTGTWQQNKPKQSNIKYIHTNEIENFSKNFDLIFFTAGGIPVPGNPLSTDTLVESQIMLPNMIIRTFPETRIIYTSSITIYGVHENTISENSSFNNPSLYARAKLAGEFIFSTHSNTAIVRLSNLYGRGMNKNLFISRAIEDAKTKGTITIFGNGKRCQDYLHVSDASNLLITIAKQDQNGPFLGAYGKSMSIEGIAETIQDLIPKTKIEYIGEDNNPSYEYDPSQSYSQLNFRPTISLSQGISMMV
jgi:UDP-glucose 4-epimerase